MADSRRVFPDTSFEPADHRGLFYPQFCAPPLVFGFVGLLEHPGFETALDQPQYLRGINLRAARNRGQDLHSAFYPGHLLVRCGHFYGRPSAALPDDSGGPDVR